MLKDRNLGNKVRIESYVLLLYGVFSRTDNCGSSMEAWSSFFKLFIELFVLYRPILINKCRKIVTFIFPYSNPLSESGNTLFCFISKQVYDDNFHFDFRNFNFKFSICSNSRWELNLN